MEVIFIKDTRENPAYKQIESITSNYDYVDAYAGHDTINYLSKLPDAPVGAYISTTNVLKELYNISN